MVEHGEIRVGFLGKAYQKSSAHSRVARSRKIHDPSKKSDVLSEEKRKFSHQISPTAFRKLVYITFGKREIGLEVPRATYR